MLFHSIYIEAREFDSFTFECFNIKLKLLLKSSKEYHDYQSKKFEKIRNH